MIATEFVQLLFFTRKIISILRILLSIFADYETNHILNRIVILERYKTQEQKRGKPLWR